MADDEDTMGYAAEEEEEQVRAPRARRKTAKYNSGDYVKTDEQDFEDEEDEEDDDESGRGGYGGGRGRGGGGGGGGASRPRRGSVQAARPKKGTKYCPSCEEVVRPSATVCEYCDYVFTSAARAADEAPVSERFVFEPEREEDGSLKVEMILARRRLQTGSSTAAAHHHEKGHPHPGAAEEEPGAGKKAKKKALPLLAQKDPRREKYCYQYHVKFKNLSYVKTKWLTYHQIEALGMRSKQTLMRWIKKVEKGDSDELEDSAFDHNYCVVEKVLDYKSDVELEVTDDEGADGSGGGGGGGAEGGEGEGEGEEGGGAKKEQQAEEEPWADDRVKACNAYVDGRPSGRSWFPMHRCRFLFNKVAEDEYAEWFYDPVDTSLYTDYLSVVQRPMCLSMIKEALESGAYEDNPYLFAEDMRQIWKNCEEYNGHNPALPVFQAGEMFSKMFERLFLAWVLAFERDPLPWEDRAARPWESVCIPCGKAGDEKHLLMCDNCDAEHHTYCLSPPLHDVPAGLWLCPRCEDLDLEARGNTHSSAGEEALREKVAHLLKERKLVRQKMYLVKWKDLGYGMCTWERPEDLKDDAKIAEYHKVNDAAPSEQVVPQDELQHHLSKQLYRFAPAIKHADEQTEVEFQAYAQIRAFHFLKWGLRPPPALLHDCGALLHAYSLVHDPMPRLLDDAEEDTDEEEDEEDEPEEPEPEEGGGEAAAVADGASPGKKGGKAGGSKAGNAGGKGGKEAEAKPEAAAAAVDPEARREAATCLADIVDHIARGVLPPTPGAPQRTGEYDVSFYRKPGETLSLNIGNYSEKVVVMGFRPREDGTKAPLERSGSVQENDVLVAINGAYVLDVPFREVIDRLGKVAHYMTLRFVSAHYRDTYLKTYCGNAKAAEKAAAEAAAQQRDFSFPAPLEVKAVALPLSEAIARVAEDGKWAAKCRVKDRVQELGKYKTKMEAVSTFRAAILKYYGADEAKRMTPELEAFLNAPDEPAVSAKAPAEKEKEKAEGGAGVGGNGGSEEAAVAAKPEGEGEAEGGDSEGGEAKPAAASFEKQSFPDGSEDEGEDGDGADEAAATSARHSLAAWSTMGQCSRLVRAARDAETAPDPAKWSELFYYEKDPPPKPVKEPKTGAWKPGRWVEQLDTHTGKSVRLFESVAQAAKTLQAHPHEIQAVLKGEMVEAKGFKWRYADEATVMKMKAQWAERAHAGGRGAGDDGDEPWKKRLPTETKVFKDGNKLRDYQLLGVQWLLKCWYQRRSCILADEMGLGKTVQIVTMLEHIFSVDGLPGPFLVVVPLSTIEHWRREFEAWTDMRFCMYYDVGGARGMRDVMREYEWYYRNRARRILKIHVLVTTYEALIKDYEEIAEIPWRCIVVDEAHRLRNWRGKLHECLKVVSQTGLQHYGYQHRVLMTGTPLQNNTQELWSLLHYIEPTKFPDLERFNERYGKVETVEQVQQLQKRLEPHLLRRTKEDVATDIPAKEETIIDVELTALQKQYYRAIFERNHAFLYNKAGSRGLLPKLMNIQMELRKCCNHPFLVEGVEESEMEKLIEAGITDPAELERQRMERGLVASSGKMVLIDKLLPKLRREDHKVLIFSQMIRVLDLLEEFCERRGFPVERLDGRVTGNQRQQAIDRFNTEANSFVFLLSTRAGGVGINLTAADTVIIFDSDWNPQNDVQAQARCHRIGQTKQVQVYRLITRKSFESEMFDRASKKLGLEQAVLGGHNFRDDGMGDGEAALTVDKPSNKEMEQLLRQGAYALLDENDDEAREFCEDDIEKIMQERTHRIVLDGPGKSASWLTKKGGAFKKRAFTSAEGSKAADVDVNDPDFWAKVMPDLKTPETLERRFLALAQEAADAAQQDAADAAALAAAAATAEKEGAEAPAAEGAEAPAAAGAEGAAPAEGAEAPPAGEGGAAPEEAAAAAAAPDAAAPVGEEGAAAAEASAPAVAPAPALALTEEGAAAAAAAREVKLAESVTAFYQDLEDMVTKLIDLHKRGKCPSRDRDICVMLLFKVSIKEDLFSAEQKAEVSKWRAALEGTRMRTCRQELGAESDDDDTMDGDRRGAAAPAKGKPGRKRGSVAGAGGAGAAAAGPASKEPDAHSDVCMVCFDGGELLLCDGLCRRAFHPKCVALSTAPADKEWLCDDCKFGNMLCLCCGEAGVVHEEVLKCNKNTCGRFYHTACLEKEPEAVVRFFKADRDKFFCPQHACAACGERPASKPDRQNFFLQCVKCPTALHLHCAVGKPVRVLTHRSMFCDKHAAETAAPPLELAAVAHIKYPEKYKGAKPGPKPKPKLIPVDADGSEVGGGGKKLGRPPKARGEGEEGEGGGGAASGGEKRKRDRKRAKEPSKYVSAMVGPFRGETFKLNFRALEEEGAAGDKEKEKDGGKKEGEGAGAGSAEGEGGEAAAAKAKDEEYCPCGKADTEKEDYIQCERCSIWYHLRCVGLEPKEAAQITNFYCAKCDAEVEAEEMRYNPIVRIKYYKHSLPKPKNPAPGPASSAASTASADAGAMGAGSEAEGADLKSVKTEGDLSTTAAPASSSVATGGGGGAKRKRAASPKAGSGPKAKKGAEEGGSGDDDASAFEGEEDGGASVATGGDAAAGGAGAGGAGKPPSGKARKSQGGAAGAGAAAGTASSKPAAVKKEAGAGGKKGGSGGNRSRASSPATLAKPSDGEETEDEKQPALPPAAGAAAPNAVPGEAAAGAGGDGGGQLYCVCRRPERPGDAFIGCDACQEWFHYECMGLEPETAPDPWICIECQEKNSAAAAAALGGGGGAVGSKKQAAQKKRPRATPSPAPSSNGGGDRDSEATEDEVGGAGGGSMASSSGPAKKKGRPDSAASNKSAGSGGGGGNGVRTELPDAEPNAAAPVAMDVGGEEGE